jgi:HEAT repeat protein
LALNLDFFYMGVSPPFSTNGPRLVTDPRLRPTPDYGTLGPSSDISGLDPMQTPRPAAKSGLRYAHLIAVVVGMVAALIAGTLRKTHPIWPTIVPARASEPKNVRDSSQLDRMKPQKQAEILLEQAVAHSDGATEQISSRIDRWNGKVEWNPQIASLTTAALNSDDMRVRESGVEVELAAYGLSKNSASVEYLFHTIDSPDHSQKIWALWALGLMANRGVDAGRISTRLTSHLKDSDEDSRRWAVEGLAIAGTDDAIPTLLATMHDDPSPVVRERAACSLAESGMFTQEQRQTTIPTLLNYTDDPSIDTQTHGWAFQALGDITHQRLPRDSAAWRSWYQQSMASSQ